MFCPTKFLNTSAKISTNIVQVDRELSGEPVVDASTNRIRVLAALMAQLPQLLHMASHGLVKAAAAKVGEGGPWLRWRLARVSATQKWVALVNGTKD